MKKIFFFLVVIFVFASCQTQMGHLSELEKNVDLESSFEIPNMEFIGFKGSGNFGQITNKEMNGIVSSKAFKNLGNKLQSGGIAIDQSEAYFGIYSLQELESYKNTKKYITFVDISDCELTYTDVTNYGGQTIGQVLMGLVVTFPIGAIVAANCPYKTKMNLKGNCKIIVYDSETHSVRGTENIVIDRSDVYKGFWNATADDVKSEIIENYAIFLSNAILEKYSRIKKSLNL